MIIGQVPTIKTKEREPTVLDRVVGRSIAIACLAATALHALALPFFFLCPGLSFKGQLDRVSASYLMFRVTCKRMGNFTKTENTIRQVASLLLFKTPGTATAVAQAGIQGFLGAPPEEGEASHIASDTEEEEESEISTLRDPLDADLVYGSDHETPPPPGTGQYRFSLPDE